LKGFGFLSHPRDCEDFGLNPARKTLIGDDQRTGADDGKSGGDAAANPFPRVASRKAQIPKWLLYEAPRQIRHEDHQGERPTFFIETQNAREIKLGEYENGPMPQIE
jgi:hypothetical protein